MWPSPHRSGHAREEIDVVRQRRIRRLHDARPRCRRSGCGPSARPSPASGCGRRFRLPAVDQHAHERQVVGRGRIDAAAAGKMRLVGGLGFSIGSGRARRPACAGGRWPPGRAAPAKIKAGIRPLPSGPEDVLAKIKVERSTAHRLDDACRPSQCWCRIPSAHPDRTSAACAAARSLVGARFRTAACSDSAPPAHPRADSRSRMCG